MSLSCQFAVVFVHATISWDAPWAIRELIHFVPAIRELNSYICSNYFPCGHFPVEYMLGLRTDVILQRGTMTLWVHDRAGSPGGHSGDGVIFSGSGSLADLVE